MGWVGGGIDGEDSRGCVDEADAGDEDVDVAVVVGAYDAHDVAGGEDECCPGKQAGELPGLVMALRIIRFILGKRA